MIGFVRQPPSSHFLFFDWFGNQFDSKRSHDLSNSTEFGPRCITIRLPGQTFIERTGGQVIIENRPAAAGIVAANSVLSSPADGYTPVVFSSGIALSLPFLAV